MQPENQTDKIQNRLLAWFKKNGRDLPWRRTRDPYAIWVSEIMLQQTQVDTVIPYYRRFLKAFPTLRRLAKADLSEVLSIWEGLGYYSRARNLHRAAKKILERFKGKIPDMLQNLLSLPGIGRYTAGAILSIAFNKDAPILDGNVKRVLSRLYAISGKSGTNGTNDLLWSLSESLVPKRHASSFNQALMDLGATVCTPKEPQCNHCPLDRLCKAKTKGNPEEYPARKAKKRIPHIHAVAGVFQKDGKVLLLQRPLEGLLGGLWEFPNWKVEGEKGLEKDLKDRVRSEMGFKVKCEGLLGPFSQTFSHFKLTVSVYRYRAEGRNRKGQWVPVANLDAFPMSRLHRRIAQTLG
jgi:A/G-specific adenine glycosylase